MAMSVLRTFTRNMATAAKINNVVVVGGGLMGSGIAQVGESEAAAGRFQSPKVVSFTRKRSRNAHSGPGCCDVPV